MGLGMRDVRQFDVVVAKFQPRRRDDLVPGASDLIGQQARWKASWLIEEGEYAGEWAMTMLPDAGQFSPFAWVPSGDLEC